MAGVSGAQRTAAYRARRRTAGLADADRSKNAQRMKDNRERLRRSKLAIREYRAKDTLRKKYKRSGDKSNEEPHAQAETSLDGYKCVQTLGKAVLRAREGLPGCPIKRASVLRVLAKEAGLIVVGPKLSYSRNSTRMDPETDALVLDFYKSNEVSWQSPDVKDRVIVRHKDNTGLRKEYIQKRYMLMSMREAYSLFREQNPDSKISLSAFHARKPPEIDFFGNLPHQVCLCKQHENIRLILEALHPHTGVAVSFKDFLDLITCDQYNESCMLQECQQCDLKCQDLNPQHILEKPDEEIVKGFQWTVQGGRICKEEISQSATSWYSTLHCLLVPFKRHVFIKRSQARYFSTSQQEADRSTVTLQLDFAENAVIKEQNEIQSAHWAHGMCTVFTAHAWIAKDVTKSFSVVSNSLDHDKNSVYTFLNALAETLILEFDDIKEIKIFTDGAASQFKQRFVLSLLHVFKQQYGISMSWHYFATSHGKGVVDGIGGCVKGAVWRRVAAGASVTNAREFAGIAAEACPNIHVLFICKEEVDANAVLLQEQWDLVKPIPNLQKVHGVKSLGNFVLQVAETSDGLEKGKLVTLF